MGGGSWGVHVGTSSWGDGGVQAGSGGCSAGLSSLLMALLSRVDVAVAVAAAAVVVTGGGAFTGLAACFVVGFILCTLGSSDCGSYHLSTVEVDGWRD